MWNLTEYLTMSRLMQQAYQENQSERLGADGWKPVLRDGFFRYDPESGLKLQVYQKGNQFTVAIAGTDIFPPDINDIAADIKFATGGMHDQFRQAISLVNRLVNEEDIPKENITYVGHSLGGGIAQILADTFGGKVFAFDPPGVSNILQGEEYQAYINDLKINKTANIGGEIWIEKGSAVSNDLPSGDYINVNLSRLQNVPDVGRLVHVAARFGLVGITASLILYLKNQADNHSLDTMVEWLQGTNNNPAEAWINLRYRTVLNNPDATKAEIQQAIDLADKLFPTYKLTSSYFGRDTDFIRTFSKYVDVIKTGEIKLAELGLVNSAEVTLKHVEKSINLSLGYSQDMRVILDHQNNQKNALKDWSFDLENMLGFDGKFDKDYLEKINVVEGDLMAHFSNFPELELTLNNNRNLINIHDGGNYNIQGGTGIDAIKVRGRPGVGMHKLSGGRGGDYLSSHDGNAVLKGEEGNDFLSATASGPYYSKTNSATLDGGEGNDIIRVTGAFNAKIYDGDGDDRVQVFLKKSTNNSKHVANIYNGKGNDRFNLNSGGEGEAVFNIYFNRDFGHDSFNLGSGSKYIFHFDSSFSLEKLVSGFLGSARDVYGRSIINFGRDSISFDISPSNNVEFKFSTGERVDYASLRQLANESIQTKNDMFFLYREWDPEEGKEIVENITGSSNNDRIIVNAPPGASSNININAGKGNDFISSSADYGFINGGEGSDRILSSGNSIIDGGLGDDVISLGTKPDKDLAGAPTIKWGKGKGNDRVTGNSYNSKGTIKFDFSGLSISEVGFNNGRLEIYETGEYFTFEKYEKGYNAEFIFKGVTLSSSAFFNLGYRKVNEDGTAAIIKVGNINNKQLYGTSGNDLFDFRSGISGTIIPNGFTYEFGKGSGVDSVISDNHGKSFDVIKIKSGINIKDLFIDEYSIEIKSTGDKYTGRYNKVVFSDGKEFSREKIIAISRYLNAGVLYSKEGDDESFTGTSKDESIISGKGNDKLEGGKGNDNLRGGEGSDTYKFKRGDGQDTIVENANSTTSPAAKHKYKIFEEIELDTEYPYQKYDNFVSSSAATPKDTDILEFDASIRPQDLLLSRINGDLLIRFTQGKDSIQIDGWFSRDAKLEKFVFADGTQWSLAQIERFASGAEQSSSGSDNILGTETNDFFNGGKGNDHIKTLEGDDNLTGGRGADILEGGAGNDHYYFELGDWKDTIIDTSSKDELNVLHFGQGITANMLDFKLEGTDLVISIPLTSDSIRVKEWSALTTEGGRQYGINQIEFADGSTWDLKKILQRIDLSIKGTDSDDQLNGTATDDVIKGLDGNDTLKGFEGNDTLIGGTGDDRLYGGKGSDTYKFARGDGNLDIIYEVNATQSKDDVDVLELGNGILPEHIRVIRDGNALVIRLNTGEAVLIDSWFLGNKVERVKFADGSSLDMNQLEALIGKATSGNDNIRGTNGDDLLEGLAGDDNLHGLEGNDTLTGGKGNDQLYGGKGSDTYKFDTGFGQDVIHETSSDNSGPGQVAEPVYMADRSNIEPPVLKPSAANNDIDTIEFGQGIKPENVSVKRESDHLILKLDSGDSITVRFWFRGKQIEQVKFADGTVWDSNQITTMTLKGTEGNDNLQGTTGDDILDGQGGNDVLMGGAGHDQIKGGAGDDVLFGDQRTQAGRNVNGVFAQDEGNNAGNDTLEGGSGDDLLSGGRGNDTYIFAKGFGQDRLQEAGVIEGEINVVSFKQGITVDDLIFERASSSFGRAIVVKVKGTNDSITIDNWFSDQSLKQFAKPAPIQRFEFDGGAVLTPEQINQKLPPLGGDIHGTANEDYLDGTTGDDNIFGYAGDDELSGEEGNDQLTGGKGDDFLDGGEGSDTYVFNRGDGQDTLSDSVYNDGEINTLKFGEGISAGDIELVAEQRNGHNLLIKIKNTADSIKLQNWFKDRASSAFQDKLAIQQIVFADGTSWSVEDMKNVFFDTTNKPTEGDDQLTGTEQADEIHGLGGNDVIDGLDGDDKLYGQGGNDTLSSSGGNALLDGGEGNDTLKAFARSNNELKGGAGDDVLELVNDDNKASAGFSNRFEGGTGNDRITSYHGNDSFVFNRGDGEDTITDFGGNDTLILGAGISKGQVAVSRDGNDMLLSVLDDSGQATGDKIRIKQAINNEHTRIETLQFADGSSLSGAELLKMALTITGTQEADNLTGSINNDTILGLGGDDTLYGLIGDDVLDGGEGNDTLKAFARSNNVLKGGAGDDVLELVNDDNKASAGFSNRFEGGTGNDSITSYHGNDRFVFNRGDGEDTITDFGGDDTLILGAGISKGQVAVSRDGNDMLLSVLDGSGQATGDKIRIKQAINNEHTRIEQVQFADGTSLNWQELVALLPAESEAENTKTVIKEKTMESSKINYGGGFAEPVLLSTGVTPTGTEALAGSVKASDVGSPHVYVRGLLGNEVEQASNLSEEQFDIESQWQSLQQGIQSIAVKGENGALVETTPSGDADNSNLANGMDAALEAQFAQLVSAYADFTTVELGVGDERVTPVLPEPTAIETERM